MSKLLGLDVGERRIGTAVGDTDLGIAFPRGIIGKVPQDKAFSAICELCKTEKIEKIIVGEPLGEENQETQRSRSIRVFIDELLRHLLEQKQGIEIVFIDESFSSKEAISRIPLKRDRKVKGKDDPIAAAILLERYMRSEVG